LNDDTAEDPSGHNTANETDQDSSAPADINKLKAELSQITLCFLIQDCGQHPDAKSHGESPNGRTTHAQLESLLAQTPNPTPCRLASYPRR